MKIENSFYISKQDFVKNMIFFKTPFHFIISKKIWLDKQIIFFSLMVWIFYFSGKDMVAVAVAVSNNSMSSTSERNENTYIWNAQDSILYVYNYLNFWRN